MLIKTIFNNSLARDRVLMFNTPLISCDILARYLLLPSWMITLESSLPKHC
ncbi:MAG: hypothetical protein LF885_04575 [Rickettsia endosymbiont of Culicoides impunctatus]|nr:MAG: hypothetical protein LF885_04575 [Rickettsia endosymbiont of Culicoides impunctatus]